MTVLFRECTLLMCNSSPSMVLYVNFSLRPCGFPAVNAADGCTGSSVNFRVSLILMVELSFSCLLYSGNVLCYSVILILL